MEKENLGFVLVDDLVIPNPKKEKVVVEEQEGFHCRCCGGQEYHKATKSNGVIGPEGWTKTVYYSCDSCSVLFQNPEKFSR